MGQDTLTLPADRAIDRARAAAARENTATRRAVTAPANAPAEDKRVGTKLDRSKPFCFVSDGSNRAYQQGNGYFNKVDQWVGEVPSKLVYDHVQPENPTLDSRRADLLASARRTIGKLESVPRIPASVLEAQRENARVLAAEAKAE